MRRADERYTEDTAQYKLAMTLASGRGAPRVREVSYYFKDYGDTEKILMFFNSPRDVAGTGYLSFSYDDESKDDDIWLYLPAMKRVRRITGSGKGDSFMGTDFTYEDMGRRWLDGTALCRAAVCGVNRDSIKVRSVNDITAFTAGARYAAPAAHSVADIQKPVVFTLCGKRRYT